jgi:hypothetical protein
VTRDKESWIDGYRKGLKERVDAVFFESVNVTVMARMAERIESLEGELARYKSGVSKCTGGYAHCCGFEIDA